MSVLPSGRVHSRAYWLETEAGHNGPIVISIAAGMPVNRVGLYSFLRSRYWIKVMEHRIGRRIAISVEVELWNGHQRCGCYTTGNIGAGGIFVKHCEDAIGHNDFLTAKISSCTFSGAASRSLTALVVHKSENGAGLMWADYDANFLSTLEDELCF